MERLRPITDHPSAIDRQSEISDLRSMRLSLKAHPKAQVELPARTRAVERANRAHFERQPAGVDAQTAADGADAGPVSGVRRDQATNGEQERINREHPVFDLPGE